MRPTQVNAWQALMQVPSSCGCLSVSHGQCRLCAQALQSKLAREGGRLGVFGALIGDKAAEVTALAQQSFGEMALPSALQQALGGSSGSASSLLSTLRGFQARE